MAGYQSLESRLADYAFLPPLPGFPGDRAAANGETAGAPFVLFLSAFGFFFSRLLLI
jgi:hypothetical protein